MRRLDRQIQDHGISDRREEGSHVPIDATRHEAVAMLDVGDARDGLEPRGWSREPHHDVAFPPRQQSGRFLQRDEPSLAHDRDAVADAFHLGEDV